MKVVWSEEAAWELAALEARLARRYSADRAARSVNALVRRVRLLYRQRGARLRQVIGDPDHLASLPGGPELARILERRREALAPLAAELAALAARGALGHDV